MKQDATVVTNTPKDTKDKMPPEEWYIMQGRVLRCGSCRYFTDQYPVNKPLADLVKGRCASIPPREHGGEFSADAYICQHHIIDQNWVLEAAMQLMTIVSKGSGVTTKRDKETGQLVLVGISEKGPVQEITSHVDDTMSSTANRFELGKGINVEQTSKDTYVCTMRGDNNTYTYVVGAGWHDNDGRIDRGDVPFLLTKALEKHMRDEKSESYPVQMFLHNDVPCYGCNDEIYTYDRSLHRWYVVGRIHDAPIDDDDVPEEVIEAHTIYSSAFVKGPTSPKMQIHERGNVQVEKVDDRNFVCYTEVNADTWTYSLDDGWHYNLTHEDVNKVPPNVIEALQRFILQYELDMNNMEYLVVVDQLDSGQVIYRYKGPHKVEDSYTYNGGWWCEVEGHDGIPTMEQIDTEEVPADVVKIHDKLHHTMQATQDTMKTARVVNINKKGHTVVQFDGRLYECTDEDTFISLESGKQLQNDEIPAAVELCYDAWKRGQACLNGDESTKSVNNKTITQTSNVYDVNNKRYIQHASGRWEIHGIVKDEEGKRYELEVPASTEVWYDVPILVKKAAIHVYSDAPSVICVEDGMLIVSYKGSLYSILPGDDEDVPIITKRTLNTYDENVDFMPQRREPSVRPDQELIEFWKHWLSLYQLQNA